MAEKMGDEFLILECYFPTGMAPPEVKRALAHRKEEGVWPADVITETVSVSVSACCTEGLEGRLATARGFGKDGDLDFSECSTHSQGSLSDGVEECCQHEGTCDCCRSAHGLTFMRNADECRSCMRHLGNPFLNPKYTQLKQRMLKTLNQRKCGDAACVETAENSNNLNNKRAKGDKVIEPLNGDEDVDDLVRKIEGVSVSTNNPKKAAKKARQKEKKLLTKLEEDQRREEEERRKKEEEERLRREQEQKEEEAKRLAEEQKRQARRQKKKNRKKREAEKSVPLDSDTSGAKPVESLAVSGAANTTSPSEAVRKVLETAQSSHETSDKPRMVTIRRHPTTHDNQNVVTITLNDEKEGKNPVYMLVNGHLVSGDTVPNEQLKSGTSEENGTDKKKKNKKKQPEVKESSSSQIPPSFSNLPLTDVNMLTSRTSDNHSPVDLEKLNLPPGITITKVPNVNISKAENPKAFHQFVGNEISYQTRNDQFYFLPDDDDFLSKKENEEFEEVVSNKTRRKRIKAAKSNDRDGDGSEDARESPNSAKHMARKTSIHEIRSREKPLENVPHVSKFNGSPKVVQVGSKKAFVNQPTPKATTAAQERPPTPLKMWPRPSSSNSDRGRSTIVSPGVTGVNTTAAQKSIVMEQVNGGGLSPSPAPLGFERCSKSLQQQSATLPLNVEVSRSNLSNNRYESNPNTMNTKSSFAAAAAVKMCGNPISDLVTSAPLAWSNNSIFSPTYVSSSKDELAKAKDKETCWDPWNTWAPPAVSRLSPKFNDPLQNYQIDLDTRFIDFNERTVPKSFAFQDMPNPSTSKSPIQRPPPSSIPPFVPRISRSPADKPLVLGPDFDDEMCRILESSDRDPQVIQFHQKQRELLYGPSYKPEPAVPTFRSSYKQQANNSAYTHPHLQQNYGPSATSVNTLYHENQAQQFMMQQFNSSSQTLAPGYTMNAFHGYQNNHAGQHHVNSFHQQQNQNIQWQPLPMARVGGMPVPPGTYEMNPQEPFNWQNMGQFSSYSGNGAL